MNGCSVNCVQLVHKLAVVDILIYHELFSQLPKSSKKQWVLDYLKMNTPTGSSNEETRFNICGQTVCNQVWLGILGLSQSYYYKVRALFRNGVVNVTMEVSLVINIDM